MNESAKNIKVMLNNPKQRNIYIFGIVMAILTLGVGFWYATKNTKQQNIQSNVQVATVPQIDAVPGASNSVRYNEMVNKSNVEEGKKAIKDDKTFVAIPVNTNTFNTNSPIDELDQQIKAQKALEEKQIAEQVIKEPIIEVVKEDATKPNENIVQNKAPEIQKVQFNYQPQAPKKYGTEQDFMLLSTLANSWKIKESKSEVDFAGAKNNSASNASNQNVQESQNIVSGNTQISKQPNNNGNVIVKAGTILNAVLETGINSDEPSPVLAKIIVGNMKGTKLIGKMTTSGKKVIVAFTTAVIPGLSSSMKINSVAIDPNTSRTGLATDVDNHYFLKYGVLLGATFLGGYSDAVANQNKTVTTSLYGTTETQGPMTTKEIQQQALGSVGKELANQTKSSIQGLQPTITVDPGTAIGVLVMDDIYENVK